jgi:hypothetical protein
MGKLFLRLLGSKLTFGGTSSLFFGRSASLATDLSNNCLGFDWTLESQL